MLIALQSFSVLAAFIAAFFWFRSARVKIPIITVAIIKEDGTIQRPPHEQAWRDQSRFNAYGALWAAGAAIAQGIALLLPLLQTA